MAGIAFLAAGILRWLSGEPLLRLLEPGADRDVSEEARIRIIGEYAPAPPADVARPEFRLGEAPWSPVEVPTGGSFAFDAGSGLTRIVVCATVDLRAVAAREAGAKLQVRLSRKGGTSTPPVTLTVRPSADMEHRLVADLTRLESDLRSAVADLRDQAKCFAWAARSYGSADSLDDRLRNEMSALCRRHEGVCGRLLSVRRRLERLMDRAPEDRLVASAVERQWRLAIDCLGTALDPGRSLDLVARNVERAEWAEEALARRRHLLEAAGETNSTASVLEPALSAAAAWPASVAVRGMTRKLLDDQRSVNADLDRRGR